MTYLKPVITLIITSFIFLSCSDTDNSKTSPNRVFSLHQIELKDNVDPVEFENFIETKIAPIYNKMKGQEFILVKGDRGSRIGKYAMILSFESIEDRNRIFPQGKDTPEDWGDDSLWEKLALMSSGLGADFTDYVELEE